MKKKLLGTVGVAVALSGLAAGPVFAHGGGKGQGRAPGQAQDTGRQGGKGGHGGTTANTAALTGSVTGTYDAAAAYAVSGSLRLAVTQTVTAGTTIDTASIELPRGITLTGTPTVSVTSQEASGTSCTGTPVVTADHHGIRVTGLACTDTDGDGVVEFTVDASGITGTTKLAAGTYAATAHFGTAPAKKVKGSQWTTSAANAVVITAA